MSSEFQAFIAAKCGEKATIDLTKNKAWKDYIIQERRQGGENS